MRINKELFLEQLKTAGISEEDFPEIDKNEKHLLKFPSNASEGLKDKCFAILEKHDCKELTLKQFFFKSLLEKPESEWNQIEIKKAIKYLIKT